MSQERYESMPWDVLAIAILMAFAIWAPLLVVPPLEPVLLKELSITRTESGLLYSIPILVLALVAIPAGFMGDGLGIKKVIGIGAVIVVAGTALRGTADSFAAFLGYSLVYGLGLGLTFPNLPKLARHCSPRERVHISMGMIIAGVLVSGGLSLAVTRALVYPATGSLQGVFLVWSAPAILAALLWWAFIKEPPCEVTSLQAAAVGVAALRKVFAEKALWLAALLFFLHNFFFYTWAGWITQYLVTKGATADLAGIILSVTLWVGIPSVLLMTQLAFRLRLRKPFLWIPSMVLALVAYAAVRMNIPLSWLVMAIAGMAASIRFTTTLTLPAELSEPEVTGTASGMVMSIGYVGSVVGPLIGGLILDFTGSYQYIFYTLAAVSIATAGVAFTLPETGGRAARPR